MAIKKLPVQSAIEAERVKGLQEASNGEFYGKQDGKGGYWNVSSGGLVSHNSTNGKQGGDGQAEFYHLNESDYSDLAVDNTPGTPQLIELQTNGSPVFATISITSKLNVLGAVGRKPTIIDETDSPYTPLATDVVIIASSTSADITINLPDGDTNRYFRIANWGSSGYGVILDGTASQPVRGELTQTLEDEEVLIIEAINSTIGWI